MEAFLPINVMKTALLLADTHRQFCRDSTDDALFADCRIDALPENVSEPQRTFQ